MRFSQAQNYAVYYGVGREQDLAKFDLAIVEPEGQTAEALAQMQSAGTLVLAYLSIMEVLPYSSDRKLLTESDYIFLDGQRFINQEYGNYWVDLRSAAWSKLLLNKAHYLINIRGFDGLFLDTIGYVESTELSADLRKALITAAAEIVRLLRQNFAEYVLVQNNGLEELINFTSPYVNGICWENPPFNQAQARPWATAVLNNLLAIKEQYGMQVLLLAEEDLAADCVRGQTDGLSRTEIIAGVLDFLVYKAPGKYIGNVNLT